jgi:hypothetical protein
VCDRIIGCFFACYLAAFQLICKTISDFESRPAHSNFREIPEAAKNSHAIRVPEWRFIEMALPPHGLRIKLASDYTGLTVWKLRTLAWSGVLPHLFQGKRLIFLIEDLDAYLISQKIPATAEAK